MNVYEAIAKSPIGVAWHEEQQVIARNADNDFVKYNPDGWQPLMVLPTLGEPLTEAKQGQSYIAVHKNGDLLQGQFIYTGEIKGTDWTYYADPRPWPQKPEATTDYNAVNKITGKMYQGTPRPRPVPKLFRSYGADYHLLTDEGRRRLERLLRESEGE